MTIALKYVRLEVTLSFPDFNIPKWLIVAIAFSNLANRRSFSFWKLSVFWNKIPKYTYSVTTGNWLLFIVGGAKDSVA